MVTYSGDILLYDQNDLVFDNWVNGSSITYNGNPSARTSYSIDHNHPTNNTTWMPFQGTTLANFSFNRFTSAGIGFSNIEARFDDTIVTFTDQVGNSIQVWRLEREGSGSPLGYMVSPAASMVIGQTYTISARSTVDRSNAVVSTGISSQINGIPACFAAGTQIATKSGYVLVETLSEGDEVMTMHHGFQPVRLVQSSKRPKTGSHAPVIFTETALANGNGGLIKSTDWDQENKALIVSQQHGVILRDTRATAFLDTDLFLIASKHLVNNDSIYIDDDGKEIEYLHLMFDTHQIINANGVWSESFYPGPEAMKGMRTEQRSEIYEIAPGLIDDPNHGYGPTALPRLTGGEYRRMIAGKGPTPGQVSERINREKPTNHIWAQQAVNVELSEQI